MTGTHGCIPSATRRAEQGPPWFAMQQEPSCLDEESTGMNELKVTHEWVEMPHKRLYLSAGAACFCAGYFCLKMADLLSPRRASDLGTPGSDLFRYTLVGVGLLLLPIAIACLRPLRVRVRRKEQDLLLRGFTEKVLARREELKKVVFSETDALGRTSVQRHDGAEIVLVESRDRLMAETAAREVATILGLPLEGIAALPNRQESTEGGATDIPFYLRPSSGERREATGLRVQRGSGLVRLQAQSPAKSQPGCLPTLMLCVSLPAIVYTVLRYSALANAGNSFPIFDIHFMVALGLSLFLVVEGTRRAMAPTVWHLTVTAQSIEVRGPGTRELLPLGEIVEMRVSAEEPDVKVGFDSYYLGLRTRACWLLLPRLREDVACALDAEIRSALRDLRGDEATR